jgi:hypothetical protein
MTYRRGVLCTITFGNGARTAPGSTSTTCSEAMSVSPLANTVSRVQASSTANRSRRRKKGGPRLRHAQTSQGAQATHLGRYARVAPSRGRHERWCARPRRGNPAAGSAPFHMFPTSAHLGGPGVWRGPDHMALGSPALAENPPGHRQAPGGNQGLPAAAEAVDCGTDLRLVEPPSSLSERL